MTRATKPVWRAVSTARGEMGDRDYVRRRADPAEGPQDDIWPDSLHPIEDVGAKLDAAGRGIAVPLARRRAGAR